MSLVPNSLPQDITGASSVVPVPESIYGETPVCRYGVVLVKWWKKGDGFFESKKYNLKITYESGNGHGNNFMKSSPEYNFKTFNKGYGSRNSPGHNKLNKVHSFGNGFDNGFPGSDLLKKEREYGSYVYRCGTPCPPVETCPPGSVSSRNEFGCQQCLPVSFSAYGLFKQQTNSCLLKN